MTSPSDMDQHPEVEEISDLAEGLLPSARAVTLQQHVDDCVLCGDVHRSLMEIRDLLGTLPGPSRMPTDVAERIDAALAAEALLDATPDTAAADRQTFIPAPSTVGSDARSQQSQGNGRGEHAGREGQAPRQHEEDGTGTAAGDPESTSGTESPHVSRETSRPLKAPAGPDRAATGPARSSTGPGRGRTVRRRRRGAVALGAALGIAVLGVGVFLIQGSGTKADDATTDQAISPRVTAATSSADDFSGSELETRVDTLLNTKPSSSPHSNPDQRGNSADTGTASTEPLMQSIPQVPYCVRQGTGRAEAVLAAQQGTYRGSPAYLLVLANPSDETKVRVYVIDATCVGATPPVKGKILQTELYSHR